MCSLNTIYFQVKDSTWEEVCRQEAFILFYKEFSTDSAGSPVNDPTSVSPISELKQKLEKKVTQPSGEPKQTALKKIRPGFTKRKQIGGKKGSKQDPIWVCITSSPELKTSWTLIPYKYDVTLFRYWSLSPFARYFYCSWYHPLVLISPSGKLNKIVTALLPGVVPHITSSSPICYPFASTSNPRKS